LRGVDVEVARSLDGDRGQVNRPEVPVSLIMPGKTGGASEAVKAT
jgi:hypothetical protein